MKLIRVVLLLTLSIPALPQPANATGSHAATQVIIVRHAEKVSSDGDPELSEAGKKRARDLARAVKDIRFNAILSTPLKRTRSTAAPVAERQALAVDTVALGNDHIQRLTAEVRKRAGQNLLVVGHSNTVPELIKALGGPGYRLTDSDYDNLFVCTIPTGENARCVQLHYGE